MEIVLRIASAIYNHKKLPGMLLCLVVLIVSCSRKQEDLPIEIKSKEAIQKLVDGGRLLNDFSKNGDTYVLNFESQALQVPVQEIAKIVADASRWKTLITFSNGQILEIPSKGGALDFIIEDIRVNPSGYNPLAAMVAVNLPAYGKIRVTVKGKNGPSGNITHLCQGMTPKQNIPIFGLYPNYNNQVDLTFTDSAGNERGTTQVHIQTTGLPEAFPDQNLVTSMPQKMEPGVNLVSYTGESEIDLSVPYMVDCNGDLRWVLLLKTSPELNKLATSIGLKRTKKGTFIAGDQNGNRLVELDMFGNLLRQWDILKLGYIFHHEITEAQNGNFLVTVTKANAKLANGLPRINDVIIEFDPLNGTVVKEWDLVNIVDSSRVLPPDGVTQAQYGQTATNWAHNNSVNEMGNDILVTMRYQGIFCLNRAGKLRWIISPHKNWGAAYQPYLLTPVDVNGTVLNTDAVKKGEVATSGFDWAWGPHTPVVIAQDHIMVFDNGYNRNWISNWTASGSNFSRVVEYKIDESKKTVQQVWSYGKERGEPCFSPAMSGVQYLSQTKNVLFCPGMNIQMTKGKGGRIVEVNPTTKEVVYEIELTASSGTGFHRVTRMPLYPDTI